MTPTRTDADARPPDPLVPRDAFEFPPPPAVPGRTRIALLALLLFGFTSAFMIVRAELPSDLSNRLPGAQQRAPNGVAITTFAHQGSPLRPGDVVLAVNGASVATGRLPRGRIGDHLVYRVRRDGGLTDVVVVLRHYPIVLALAANWATMLLVGTLGSVALYVFARRPDDRAARALLMVAGLFACGAAAWVLWPGVLDDKGSLGWWVTLASNLAYALMWGALLHFALVFPRPRGVFALRPRLLGLAYVLPLALYGVYLAGALPVAKTALQTAGFLMSTSVLGDYVLPVTIIATVVRAYRGIGDAAGRQGLRWFLISLAAGVMGWLAFWKLPELILGRDLLARPLPPLLFVPCPLALGLAILHDRVFDIDIVIRRSLVYTSLTGCAVAMYATTVGLLTTLLPRRSEWVSIAATALVAVAFSPLHRRIQRGVSRLFYGERDDPYAIVSRLGRHLEATQAPSEILPQVVDTMAQALRLPYVAVELTGSDGAESAAQFGTPIGDPVSLPLTYQGQCLGRLMVAERSPGEGFGPTDQRLLNDLARQVGNAAHTVIVARNLQRSRERLVTAREEERRRLQRDLHDGVGPALGAAVLQLQAAKRLIRADPQEAELLIGRLTKETQATIADIRHLVNNLRPPSLDQLGLVVALQQRAEEFAHCGGSDERPGGALDVSVQAEGDLRALPAAVEVAAFRIVCEAVNNASRHGRASRCDVRLVRNGALEVQVADDGAGLPPHYRPGVGLTSMRERAAELGGWCSIEAASTGGTMVRAHLPLHSP